MKYGLFIHMFRKHFPKFKFLKDTNKNKQKDQFHLFFQLKVFYSSILLNNNKKKNFKKNGSDIGKRSKSVISEHPLIPNQ